MYADILLNNFFFFFQNLVQFCNCHGNLIRIQTDRSFRGKYKDFPKYFSLESLFKTLEKD